MRYRATDNVNLPFQIVPMATEVGKSRVDYRIGVKADFAVSLYATNVVFSIPVPLNTAAVKVNATNGKAKYVASENAIEWRIARLNGGSELSLTAGADLMSMTQQKPWTRPPISLSFSILMFTSSGLSVRYLKVIEKSGYRASKWIKYETRAGTYQIRF